MRKLSKYGAQTITVRDPSGEIMTFDSKRECERYYELAMLERGKAIWNLRRQVKYELIPTQYDKKGQIIERACNYIADFVYIDTKSGQTIVEDSKGCKTRDYIIKRKLMLHVHGIRIREV